MSDEMSNIMSRIKSRRLDLQLTYQDLSNKTGIPKSTLQRYETGFIKNMPLDKLGDIATALECEPTFLMGWSIAPKSIFTREETQLVENYRSLNQEGQDKLSEYADDLMKSGKYKKLNKDNMDKKQA